jgi:hypothetical protein
MLVRYATAETLSIERVGLPTVVRRTAHRASFIYDLRPGYLYVRSRAISSRTNDNFDTFPAEEIEKSWSTFIGKPVFVNHNNEDHKRARGVIIDAALHKDTALDGSPDTWVEVLMEVDGIRFPKLAKALIKGDIERTSMGCDVTKSTCSICGNEATTPLEYCAHLPRLKGKRIRRVDASGKATDVLTHEICVGLSFFENSLLVEQPADPTALILGVVEGSNNVSLGQSLRERTSSMKTGSRSDQVYVVKIVGNGLDAAYVTLGGPYESWDLDAPANMVEADRLMIANPGAELVDGETYDSLTPKMGSKLGYGEVKAPAAIDTLRIRECAVCGEADSWDGEGRCRVCSYLPPPEPFRSPDLDVAQKADMRSGPVNPALFKAPPFVVPEDQPEKQDDAKLDDPTATDPTLNFRSARHPVHVHLSPVKGQDSQGAAMRPDLASFNTQAGIIEQQRRVIAGLQRRLSDTDNPGDPVAEPSSAPASQGASNEDVLLADAKTEVTTPGGVIPAPTPLATTDPTIPGAAADTGTLLVSNDAPTVNTEVTTPVGNAGSQPPLEQTKTEIQPNTGGEATTPNFLGEGGAGTDWANKAAKIVEATQAHTFASIRLARLRIAAGLVQGDDLQVAGRIAAEMELAAIRSEIGTLAAVSKAASRMSTTLSPQRTATRTMPSLVSAASPVQTLGSRPSMNPSDDEFLFI